MTTSKDGLTMKMRFTKEQIIGFLRKSNAIVKVKTLGRKYGFSTPSYYRWKTKFGSLRTANLLQLTSKFTSPT
jgi:putative transposase